MSYPCPCCGYYTRSREPGGTFDLCEVCFWEDDQLQFNDHDLRGGANHVSLNEARENFKKIGACEPQFKDKVRPPRPDEMPHLN